MDQQWQQYNPDPNTRQPRYTQSHMQNQQTNGSGLAPNSSSTYGYDAYQTPSNSSHANSLGVSPIGTPHRRTYSGEADVKMEDADPYNSTKYPQRPTHQQRPSASYLNQQEGARRYSPSKALSPSSPYTPNSAQSAQGSYGHYASHSTSARQSPTRSTPYATPNHSYYSTPSELSLSQHPFQNPPSNPHVLTSLLLANSRQPPLHLPPIQPINPSPDHYYPSSATAQLNAVFGRETKSPRQMRPTYSGGPGESTRGPVPTFTSLRSLNELQPRINPQPAYRRADPEGGFISPLQALTTQLPSTYRICNPQFKYESSRNPRRVLTKPSKGVKNDGFDNEDSDYILYVNDILGNEDNGHKNRYLILDVLGQGTFGQVVKCQNLKTQEVVAVKVVKNRTAYFNQSMMEVSVLDLVCFPFPWIHGCSGLMDVLSSTANLTKMMTIISYVSKTPSSIDNIFALCSSCSVSISTN